MLGASYVEKVVAIQRSRHGNVIVVDAGDRLILRLGTVFGPDQSAMLKCSPNAVPIEYLRYAVVATVVPASLRRALVVGLGAGTFPRLLRREWPRAQVEVVELDKAVLQVAQRWFGLQPDSKLHVTIENAARFVEVTPHRWDLILVDAYGPGGLPPSLERASFFAGLRRCTEARGVVVLNLAVADYVTERQLVGALADQFVSSVTLRAPHSGNLLAIASDTPLPGRHEWERRLRRAEREHHFGFSIAQAAARLRPVAHRSSRNSASELSEAS